METARYENVKAFEAHAATLATSPEAKQRRVLVCCGTGCLAGGAAAVAEELEKQLAVLDKKQRVQLNLVCKKTGCHGFCEKGPLVVLMPEAIFYKGVKPKDVEAIVQKTLLGGEVIDKLL
ncbi:MAG: NAD(P)H-dependent oxidoreductase subunit E, partial [Deltaproteobacteria bacterium]|nr:NAD(P)H-dependent oxidoreductase subunit E [Deltaproteobacteria bacterium]